MIDIVVSIKDKEYPFFMKLVENFDFVTVKGQPSVQPDETGKKLQEESDKTTSPALEGIPMSSQEFTNWIEQAEAMPSVTLQQAKTKWAKKRRELQQLIK